MGTKELIFRQVNGSPQENATVLCTVAYTIIAKLLNSNSSAIKISYENIEKWKNEAVGYYVRSDLDHMYFLSKKAARVNELDLDTLDMNAFSDEQTIKNSPTFNGWREYPLFTPETNTLVLACNEQMVYAAFYSCNPESNELGFNLFVPLENSAAGVAVPLENITHWMPAPFNANKMANEQRSCMISNPISYIKKPEPKQSNVVPWKFHKKNKKKKRR